VNGALHIDEPKEHPLQRCNLSWSQADSGFIAKRRDHPKGESKLKRIRAEDTLLSCAGVQTPSGKIQMRWESSSAATPMGQLAYPIEFLGLTELWSSWTKTCL
jgi:hypothetical protein